MVQASTMLTSDEGLRVGNLEFANYFTCSSRDSDTTSTSKLEIYALVRITYSSLLRGLGSSGSVSLESAFRLHFRGGGAKC